METHIAQNFHEFSHFNAAIINSTGKWTHTRARVLDGFARSKIGCWIEFLCAVADALELIWERAARTEFPIASAHFPSSCSWRNSVVPSSLLHASQEIKNSSFACTLIYINRERERESLVKSAFCYFMLLTVARKTFLLKTKVYQINVFPCQCEGRAVWSSVVIRWHL